SKQLLAAIGFSQFGPNFKCLQPHSSHGLALPIFGQSGKFLGPCCESLKRVSLFQALCGFGAPHCVQPHGRTLFQRRLLGFTRRWGLAGGSCHLSNSLREQRQEHLCEFKASLEYRLAHRDGRSVETWAARKGTPGIIAANALVFCLWRVPSLHRTMIRYFTSNPASKVLCSPMLLSTFSHFSLFHMAANMYVLWSFSSSIVNILGREQFVAVYLSAGVISNFVSYVCKVVTGRYGPSLGASGAIMTVLAAVCTKIPEGRLAIIFLPVFTFTAGNALKAIIAMDTAGMVLGWKFFDHAAHLGGALFGIWYITYGHELIWKNREPLVKIWHEIRTNGPKKGGGSK
ncbi:presenilins-associated rhomboid, mitochondrial isoform X1, partial [Sigmodon hispidus]